MAFIFEGIIPCLFLFRKKMIPLDGRGSTYGPPNPSISMKGNLALTI